jgi:hypothetical protein
VLVRLVDQDLMAKLTQMPCFHLCHRRVHRVEIALRA